MIPAELQCGPGTHDGTSIWRVDQPWWSKGDGKDGNRSGNYQSHSRRQVRKELRGGIRGGQLQALPGIALRSVKLPHIVLLRVHSVGFACDD